MELTFHGIVSSITYNDRVKLKYLLLKRELKAVEEQMCF